MLPLTRGPEANNNLEINKISELLETLALFFVVASIAVMILALVTVFQNGFQ